ncbi:MAG: FAD-dependent oxidoreductase [bacterium]
MAGDTGELSGPDFTAGVDAESLQVGAKLLGHAFGSAVLLVRLNGEFVAIGATCTHYGAPLSQGVVDGDTVRCPWHHACFNLRTGEALRAPALNPVACYEVERRGARVVVTRKVERDPLAPSSSRPAPVNPSRRMVIVGAGAAGAAAAEMLRRSGHTGSVTMIDAEPDSPYDRPNLSKDFLAGSAPEEWIPLRAAGFYAEHQVNIVRGRVTRVDIASRTIHVDGQASISYDALLLATGAEPVHLGIPGDDQPHVHYLRSLADSRSLIAAISHATRAVVIGSSFIGLEVAASLRTRGLDVHVVAPESVPLARVLGPELGAFVKRLHEEKGVVFHLEHKPLRIDGDAVVLDDGTRLSADLVVVGVGVRPRLELAEHAGLAIDRGVSVNEYLETSAPGVFAAGDIARWPDPHSAARIRVEHWVVAERMGQTAARNMLGFFEKYEQVPFFWSAHYDVSINYVGHAEHWDAIRMDGRPDDRDVSVRLESEGRLLALATIFRDEESLRAEIAMERRTDNG